MLFMFFYFVKAMLFIYFVKALFYLLYLFIDCFNIVEDFYIVMITKMYYINSILF